MLVHRSVTPSIKFAGTRLYTWVERGTVRLKCLAQEHSTMSLARAQTRTACSEVERTNHETTVPLTNPLWTVTGYSNRLEWPWWTLGPWTSFLETQFMAIDSIVICCNLRTFMMVMMIYFNSAQFYKYKGDWGVVLLLVKEAPKLSEITL